MSGWLLVALLSRITISGGAWATYDYFRSLQGTSRPPQALRFGLTGGISFLGLSWNLTLLFNSDDRFTPQATSVYGLHPAWSWGRLYIGDFSPTFSPMTLSGVVVRGGGIDLFPGPFRLFVVRGRVRALETDTAGLTRFLMGMRVALGRARGVCLEFLQVRDQGNGPVPCQGNWILGLGFKFRGQHLALEGRTAGSVHTRDLKARSLRAFPLPVLLDRLLVMNASSHADYAYEVQATVHQGPAFLQVHYGVIGPGYVSLGLASLQNDRRDLRVAATVTLAHGRASLGLTHLQRSDNLLQTRDATTRTANSQLSLGVTPVPALRLTIGLVRLRFHREPGSQTPAVDHRVQSLALSGSLRGMPTGRPLHLGVTYHYNRVDGAREQARHTGGLRLRLQNLVGPLGLELSVNNLIQQDSTGITSGFRSQGSLLLRDPGGRWRLSGGVAYRRGQQRGGGELHLGGQLSLDRAGTLSLRAYHRWTSGSGDTDSRLTLTHRLSFR